jgi:hypothetical protein
MNREPKLDLGKALTSRESRVLSGRDRGIECRQRFNVAALDGAPGIVIVSIPRDIYSVNTSFFLGLFGESVRSLGKEAFIAKYKFECDDVHRETIAGGIERALKESSIFMGRKLA